MSERRWLRSQILGTPQFAEFAAAVAKFIGKQYRTCLVGGLAVAYHANPPVTVDVDFLVEADMADLDRAAWHFESSGWERIPIRFPVRSPGFPQFGVNLRNDNLENSEHSEWKAAEIDLIATGSDRFLKSIVANAMLCEVQKGLSIRVAKPEDLIVMKTLVGREKDLDDVAAIQRKLKGKLDTEYIDSMLNELL